MNSIRTNIGALISNQAALASKQALDAVKKALDASQNQLSTGKSVNSPGDDPTVWEVAKTMESERNRAKAIQFGLKAAEQVTSIAVEGAEAVIDQITRIRNLLVEAVDEHNDPGTILNEIRYVIEGIGATISSATVGGVNLLSHEGAGGIRKDAYTVITSLNRGHGEAQARNSVIVVDSVNLEASPLVELRNLFLFKGDHDSTVEPAIPGTPLGENKISVAQGDDLTQSEFADLISAAKRERTAFGAISRTGFPSEAAKRDYRQAFSAYYDAVITVGGLSDTQKADLRQKKDDAELAMQISQGTPNRVFKTLADEAIAEFHKAAENAGLKSSAELAAIEGKYRVGSEAEKKAIYKSVYPGNFEEVEFDSRLALDLITKIDLLLNTSVSKAADLGLKHQWIVWQAETLDQQIGSLDTGVGALIDANMDEEVARLKASQVQQQLAIQALSIANQASQSVWSSLG